MVDFRGSDAQGSGGSWVRRRGGIFSNGHIDNTEGLEKQEGGNQVSWDEDTAVKMANYIFDAIKEDSGSNMTKAASTASDTNSFRQRIVARKIKIANIKDAFKDDGLVTENGLEIDDAAILMTLQPKITATGEQKHGGKIAEDGSDKNCADRWILYESVWQKGIDKTSERFILSGWACGSQYVGVITTESQE